MTPLCDGVGLTLIQTIFPLIPAPRNLRRGRADRYSRATMSSTQITPSINSLGIPKAPAATRVVVAMSGGVDSSVVAAMLHDQGYDVLGVTLQLYDSGAAAGRKGACCAGQDIYDARRVADGLAIPHYVLDYETRFREAVVDTFADAYLRGETPIPCVDCNRTVKFRDLLAMAQHLDADVLATGHYVRWQDQAGAPALYRAVDHGRDQSYFLYATTADQLRLLRFPLGAMTKDEVRALAGRYGLLTAAKPDSQDICFVPDGDYGAVVRKLRPEAGHPGDIVHIDGRVLGRHPGIVNFTIGQRRGLGLTDAGTEPLFVVRIDPASHRIVVGPRAALAVQTVTVDQINWLGPAVDSTPVQVKLRSSQAPVDATLTFAGQGASLTLAKPQYGVAPGQAAVFYEGDRLLGGGTIRRSDALTPAEAAA